ncbi:hypothetical protein K9M79_05640 [Candidatus Woesearchaeota archaeon]|nr:hypothetical protein [Candidatus Woesearchaeota archaeon]
MTKCLIIVLVLNVATILIVNKSRWLQDQIEQRWGGEILVFWWVPIICQVLRLLTLIISIGGSHSNDKVHNTHRFIPGHDGWKYE